LTIDQEDQLISKIQNTLIFTTVLINATRYWINFFALVVLHTCLIDQRLIYNHDARRNAKGSKALYLQHYCNVRSNGSTYTEDYRVSRILSEKISPEELDG
jgi:hypothetical protein